MLHLLLRVTDGAVFVLFDTSRGNPANRIAERIANFGIEIQVAAVIRESGRLQIRVGDARCILTDELLPRRAPARGLAIGIHPRRFNRVTLHAHVETGASDKTNARVIVSIVRKIVDSNSLSRQTVPDIDIEGEETGYGSRLLVRKEVLAHLSVIVR